MLRTGWIIVILVNIIIIIIFITVFMLNAKKVPPGSSCLIGNDTNIILCPIYIANILSIGLIIARELNRQLQELQIQLQRNRAKIAEDAQQLEVDI